MTDAVVYSTNFANRANKYVPGMKYSADVEHAAPCRVDFGTPAASETASIQAALDATAGLDVTLATPVVAGATWGQCVRIVLGAAGAVAVNVYGYDYWAQPIRETLTTNGTTAVNGVKAFKIVTRYTVAAVATTFAAGFAGILGLPYKVIKCLSEELDDVIVGTLGTITGPVLTDPQTATTGDPRGRFTPNSTLTGAARLKGTFLFSSDLNAAGRGGLMGIAHLGA
jgi:hypothetical protein